MPIDLMTLAKDALGGGLIDQLARDLNESPEVTRSAVDAGIPAVLGGLLGKMQSSGGASEVMGALDEDDDGLLSNLSGALLGGGQSSLLAKGASLVAMIYGARQGGVLGSIASMVGMRNAGGATRLMGMLAPVVMGFIRKQRKSDNLDLAGVQNLLSDQKQYIADKLPTEMRSSLGIADMFDTPAAGPREVVAPAVQTEKASSGSSWLPWAMAAGAAFLAFVFWPSSNDSAPAETAVPAAQVIATEVEEVSTKVEMPTEVAGGLGNIDELAGGLTERLSGLTDKFAGVSDLGSARELAGELGDANSYLDSINLDGMPTAARDSLGSMVGPTVDKLERAVVVAYKIPGVQNVLEPMVSPLMDRLRGF